MCTDFTLNNKFIDMYGCVYIFLTVNECICFHEHMYVCMNVHVHLHIYRCPVSLIALC